MWHVMVFKIDFKMLHVLFEVSSTQTHFSISQVTQKAYFYLLSNEI